MTEKILKVVGAVLYACEGTKARKDRRYDRLIYSIELTNSDPKIIKTFSRFLYEILEIDRSRIRGQLFTYPDLDEKQLINFWAEVSGIPHGQFQKSIFLKGSERFKPSSYGTFKIRYSCKEDFLRLQKMIDDVWRDAGVA